MRDSARVSESITVGVGPSIDPECNHYWTYDINGNSVCAKCGKPLMGPSVEPIREIQCTCSKCHETGKVAVQISEHEAVELGMDVVNVKASN
jgi:hypothetical protein